MSLVLLVAACGGEPPGQGGGSSGAQEVVADSHRAGTAAAAETAAAAVDTPAAPPPGPFVVDPARVRPGQRLRGLTVRGVDVHRVFEDSVWSGTVAFDGELVLGGTYQAHFDWPEVREVCFHVSRDYEDRVPRFPPDAWTSPHGKRWFCFRNGEEAIRRLGPADRPREAVVVVRGYTHHRMFTDAVDGAELVRVVRYGPPSRATLRDVPAANP